MEWGTICSENMIHTMKPHECTLMRMLHHWIIHAACIVQPSQQNTMVYTGTGLSWYGKVLKILILLLISSYLIPFTPWYSNFPAISLHLFHGFSHMSLDFVGVPAIQTIHSARCGLRRQRLRSCLNPAICEKDWQHFGTMKELLDPRSGWTRWCRARNHQRWQ